MRRALRVPLLAVVLALLAGLLVTAPAGAAATPDELAVTVVGDGSTTGNVAVPVSIAMLDSFGDVDRSVPLPTTTVGTQRALTLGADRDQQGALQQSTDRRFVTLGGFEAALGTATNDTAAPTVRRVIGRIGTDGAIDTTTSLADAFSLRHVRGVVTTDGERFWAGGHGGDAPTTKGGVLTVSRGQDAPAPVVSGSANLNNARVPVIHDGQLYVSSDRSGFTGVNQVGTGTPTAAATQTLVAAAPVGSSVAHDFAFVGDALYVTYTEGTPVLAKYVRQDGAWTLAGTHAGAFWGVTGRVADGQTVLYTVRGAAQGNQVVQLVDAGGAGAFTATETIVRTAEPGTAFRGIAFAPGFMPGNGPVTTAPARPTVTWDTRVVGGVGNVLSGVLGDATNPVARGAIVDPEGEDVTATVSSSNPAVASEDAIDLTLRPDGTFTLAVDPSAAGKATLTVTATTDDGRTATSSLTYWVSPSLTDPTARTYVGMSDASAAEDAGDGHLFVGDDDSNEIRLFGPQGGEAISELDVSGDVPAIQPGQAFDLEASARTGDTLLWVGSLGNTRSGNVRLDRDIVLATTVEGEGKDAELAYDGHARGVRQALVDWDAGDKHGLGADHFGFTAATQPGVSAEGPNSLNVEGAAMAPDGSTLWLGFRSPQVPLPAGGDALIVGVRDIEKVVHGAPATIGEPITLDLGGRAIRDMQRTDDGQYLLIAGSADDSGRFAIFGWTGDPDDQPVLSSPLPTLSGWDGSYEAIVAAPDLQDGASLTLLKDSGTVDVYGDGTEAQDLGAPELKKFVAQPYTLDFNGALAPDATTSTSLIATSPSAGTVDLTARVTSEGSTEGTVEVLEGPDVVATADVVQGRATARLSGVTPGRHTYRAVFMPEGDRVQGSTSAEFSVSVAAATVRTSTSLTVSPSTGTYGRQRVATVRVTAAGRPAAGRVVVRIGRSARTATLDAAGRAKVTVPRDTAAGRHVVTATYQGTAGVGPSTASTVLRVTKASARVSLARPVVVASGKRARVRVTVTTSRAPRALRPTGRVSVRAGGKVLGQARLVRGSAKITLKALPRGKHRLVVTYSGSSNVKTARSTAKTIRVR